MKLAESAKLRLVVDTNILVSALSSRSAAHWLIQALRSSVFDLVTTTEILLEYEEILGRKYSPEVADSFVASLQELPNAISTTVYYRWKLLTDPDDDKFVEAALASGADFIVSEDAHFRHLASVEFPKIHVLTLSDLHLLLSAP